MSSNQRNVVTERDAFWMRRALAEAERGRGHVEPNPMVGAVLVRDDRLIAVGHHGRFGGPHAEVVALDRAGGEARGATLHVTLEPCCHQGKTPPCVDRILQAGPSRVVVAHRDPFPKVDGGGLARLREAGIAVAVGIESVAARRLNGPYLKRLATGRPYVIAKWAMTLDGKLATARGDSAWVSSPESRARVHELRGRVDAIVIGIGTALQDDPMLDARPPGPRVASRVVLDSRARLPWNSKLVQSAREIPVLVAVGRDAPADRIASLRERGCVAIEFADSERFPVGPLLTELGRMGMTNVLVEGGGRVLGAFLDAGEVDAVDVYVAPKLEGGPAIHAPFLGRGNPLMADALTLAWREVSQTGGDVRIRGGTPNPWNTPIDEPP